MRGIAVVVVVQFCSAIIQISRSYFLKHNLDITLLHYLPIKHVVSDHFRWSNFPLNQNERKRCLHLDQIRAWHRCLNIICVIVKSMKTVPKPSRSPRLVSLNSFNFDQNLATHRKVFAPFLFIAFVRKMIPFFRFSKAAFRSMVFIFFLRFSIKQLFYLGLLDKKWS